MAKQRYLLTAVPGGCDEFSVGVEVWNIFDAAPQRVPGPPRKKVDLKARCSEASVSSSNSLHREFWRQGFFSALISYFLNVFTHFMCHNGASTPR